MNQATREGTIRVIDSLVMAPLILVMSVVAAPAANLEIHFVDVGQGDCTVISCPNGNKILVDCGSGRSCSRTGSADYVRSILDGQVYALVITHPHTDHFGLIEEALTGTDPAKIIRPDGPLNEYGSCGFDTWLQNTESNAAVQAIALPVDFHDAQSTPNSDLDCGAADIWILAANVQATDSASNARSVVLLIDFNNFEIILTGDATEDTEAKILQWYNHAWLDAEVYKIPHHGSSTTSEDQELGVTVEPSLALASAGYSNTHGHPRKRAFKKLYGVVDDLDPSGRRQTIRWCSSQNNCYDGRTKKDIYATASSGTVIIGSDGSKYWIIERHERAVK